MHSSPTLSFSYVNSVLQALYFCHPFRELVAQFPDKSNPATDFVHHLPIPAPSQPTSRGKNTKTTGADKGKGNDTNGTYNSDASGPPIPSSPPTIFSALRALFVHISKNTLDKGTVSPKAFMEKLRSENELFRSTMHQDAHEFLNYLLNRVAEDLEEEDKTRSRGSSGEDCACAFLLGCHISLISVQCRILQPRLAGPSQRTCPVPTRLLCDTRR